MKFKLTSILIVKKSMPDKPLFINELKINSLYYFIPQFGIAVDKKCGNVWNFYPAFI